MSRNKVKSILVKLCKWQYVQSHAILQDLTKCLELEVPVENDSISYYRIRSQLNICKIDQDFLFIIFMVSTLWSPPFLPLSSSNQLTSPCLNLTIFTPWFIFFKSDLLLLWRLFLVWSCFCFLQPVVVCFHTLCQTFVLPKIFFYNLFIYFWFYVSFHTMSCNLQDLTKGIRAWTVCGERLLATITANFRSTSVNLTEL